MILRRSPNNFKDEWLLSIRKNDIEDVNIVKETEEALAKYIGVKYCSLLCNGTAAIYTGMLSLGLKPGDGIVLPGFGYWSVDLCAKKLGLDIKYVDVKYDTMCMDPDLVEAAIDDNTKVICFINHLGYVGEDLLKIRDIADRHGIYFFEDSAQCIGQVYDGKMAGTFGNTFGIYSFSGNKLIRTGEGGCLFTDNLYIHEYVQKARDMQIFNFMMSDLCARLLNCQLKEIDELTEKRAEVYKRYIDFGLKLPSPYITDNNTGYNAIVYLSKKANKISQALNAQNIDNRYDFYKTYGSCHNANRIKKEHIELPSDYNLTDSDIRNIISIIRFAER